MEADTDPERACSSLAPESRLAALFEYVVAQRETGLETRDPLLGKQWQDPAEFN